MAEYSEYKDSGIPWIGKIPSHWKIKPIRSFLSQSKELNEDDNATLLTLSQYKGVNIRNGNEDSAISAAESLIGYNVVHKGQFVMNIMLAWNGSYGVSDYDGVISPAYAIFNFKDNVCKAYYHHLWRTRAYQDAFKTRSKGIVDSRLRLYPQYFLPFYTSIPPKNEQEAIVAYLDKVTADIDKAIAAKERIIASLEERRKIIITHAVTHGINPDAPMKDSGIDWLGEIPAHWDVKRFKNIAQVKANLVPPQRYYDYPQISPDCIEKGTGRLISYQTVKESGVISDNHLFFKGQIVYSKIRPNLNKLIIAPFDGLCSADMYPIETNENIIYLQYLMLSGIFVSQVSAVIAERVKMPKINKTELGEIRIPIPSGDEQTEIVNFLKSSLEPIEVAVSKERKLINLLRERKNIIINETVTGKVKVI